MTSLTMPSLTTVTGSLRIFDERDEEAGHGLARRVCQINRNAGREHSRDNFMPRAQRIHAMSIALRVTAYNRSRRIDARRRDGNERAVGVSHQ